MSKIRRLVSSWCLVGLVFGILNVQVVNAQQDTVVRCRFEKPSINKGAETIIYLEVLDVVDLFAYQLDMTFDPVLAEVYGSQGDPEDSRMVYGDFLLSELEVYNEIHNDIGAILMAITQIEPSAPQSGSGELAYGFVSGQQEGTVEFIFEEVILLDHNGKEIPHGQENCTLLISAGGQVTVTPTETLAPSSDTPAPSGTWTATQTQPTTGDTQTPVATTTSSLTGTAQPSSTPSPGPNDTPTISPTAQPTDTPTVPLTPQPGNTPTSGFSPTPLPSFVLTTVTPYPSSTPTVTMLPTSTRTMVPEPTPKPPSGFYIALCVTFCFAMLALIAVIMGIIWYIRQAR